ncbi:hypothetical protein [Cytobacillus oceanisediminis]
MDVNLTHTTCIYNFTSSTNHQSSYSILLLK